MMFCNFVFGTLPQVVLHAIVSLQQDWLQEKQRALKDKNKPKVLFRIVLQIIDSSLSPAPFPLCASLKPEVGPS